MVEETVVDGKGRIAIPKRLREKLGLREGSKVRSLLEDGRIALVNYHLLK